MENKFFTKSERMSQEYCCTVVRLGEILEIPGANTVAKTLVNGRTIVIGKDHKHGDVMIYCSNESQLNFDFLSVNNLFEKIDRNCNAEEVNKWLEEHVDASEEEIKEYKRTRRGYFDEKGRVRMKKLAGEMSMGVLFELEQFKNWCPMLDADLEKLVGLDFDTVNGVLFIKAYVPESAGDNGHHTGSGPQEPAIKMNRMIPGQFAFHYDTQLFEKVVNRFKPEDVVAISNKLHGCVEKSTIVDTLEFGKKTIGEIVDNKIECHIKAFDTHYNKDVYVPIDDFYLLKNDGEWYEIELDDGKKITITGNNPVWVPELNAYRRVDELTGEEYLQTDE